MRQLVGMLHDPVADREEQRLAFRHAPARPVGAVERRPRRSDGAPDLDRVGLEKRSGDPARGRVVDVERMRTTRNLGPADDAACDAGLARGMRGVCCRLWHRCVLAHRRT
jgi:hypothetical protein